MLSTICNSIIVICGCILVYMLLKEAARYVIRKRIEKSLCDHMKFEEVRLFTKCGSCGHEYEHSIAPFLEKSENIITFIKTIPKDADRISLEKCPNCRTTFDLIVQRLDGKDE